VSASTLLAQARTVLAAALELRPSDEVLILWDETVSRELIDALRRAAVELHLQPFTLIHLPLAAESVPETLGAVMTGPNAIVLAISSMGTVLSSAQYNQALSAGAKVCSVHYLRTAEDALRLLPSSIEEVRELHERTNRGSEIMKQVCTARVTSRAGTDMTCALGQYRVRTHSGVIAPGTRQILPAGQVTRVPNDRSANGVVVIDRSIGADDFKELPEPVRLTVQDGYVTAIEGGIDAQRLRSWLSERGEPEMYHLTELAFGTNPRCQQTGATAPSEDTHTSGCVSFALGADVHIGGNTRASAHVDMTMRSATLELDGTVVVRAGVLAY
jgi:2,5-dihydroxypyridine 5,6-dioxygenase